MKVIYICGPLSAGNAWEQEQNVRRAEEAALRVWWSGGVPICPHTMSRFYGGMIAEERCLEGDLEILGRCDALLALEGWRLSQGSKAEMEFAREKGIPICYSLEQLEEWLKAEYAAEEKRQKQATDGHG